MKHAGQIGAVGNVRGGCEHLVAGVVLVVGEQGRQVDDVCCVLALQVGQAEFVDGLLEPLGECVDRVVLVVDVDERVGSGVVEVRVEIVDLLDALRLGGGVDGGQCGRRRGVPRAADEYHEVAFAVAQDVFETFQRDVFEHVIRRQVGDARVVVEWRVFLGLCGCCRRGRGFGGGRGVPARQRESGETERRRGEQRRGFSGDGASREAVVGVGHCCGSLLYFFRIELRWYCCADGSAGRWSVDEVEVVPCGRSAAAVGHVETRRWPGGWPVRRRCDGLQHFGRRTRVGTGFGCGNGVCRRRGGRRRAVCDVESVVGPAAVRSGERESAALVARNQRGAQRADDGERDDHAGDDAHHRAGGFGPIGDRRGLRGGFRRISAAVGDAGFGRGGLAASGVGGVVIAVLPGGRVLRGLSGGGIGVRVRGRVACDPGCAARRALAGLCAGRLRGLRLLRGGVARGGLRRLGGRRARGLLRRGRGRLLRIARLRGGGGRRRLLLLGVLLLPVRAATIRPRRPRRPDTPRSRPRH